MLRDQTSPFRVVGFGPVVGLVNFFLLGVLAESSLLVCSLFRVVGFGPVVGLVNFFLLGLLTQFPLLVRSLFPLLFHSLRLDLILLAAQLPENPPRQLRARGHHLHRLLGFRKHEVVVVVGDMLRQVLTDLRTAHVEQQLHHGQDLESLIVRRQGFEFAEGEVLKARHLEHLGYPVDRSAAHYLLTEHLGK